MQEISLPNEKQADLFRLEWAVGIYIRKKVGVKNHIDCQHLHTSLPHGSLQGSSQTKRTHTKKTTQFGPGRR